jgi:hypothetical protein
MALARIEDQFGIRNAFGYLTVPIVTPFPRTIKMAGLFLALRPIGSSRAIALVSSPRIRAGGALHLAWVKRNHPNQQRLQTTRTISFLL